MVKKKQQMKPQLKVWSYCLSYFTEQTKTSGKFIGRRGDILKLLTICRISIVFCFSLIFSQWYENSNEMLMS